MVLVLLAPMFTQTMQNAAGPGAGQRPALNQPVAAQPAPAPRPQVTQAAATDGFREKTIPADRGGQYSVDALIDGVNVHMLVDTGATMVTISASLADRIGLTPTPGAPKWTMRTANGESTATPVKLKNVSLGSIFMNDVDALIVDRSAGDVNLLGASFLKRLASVEQRNGSLILRQ